MNPLLTALKIARVASPALLLLALPTWASAGEDSPEISLVERGSARAQVLKDLQRFEQVGSGFRTHNFNQNLSFGFDKGGFETLPSPSGWTWGLELQSYGPIDRQTQARAPLGLIARDERLTCKWGADFEEWYLNDQRGLEHGYTLHAVPQGTTTFAIEIAIRGPLNASIDADRRSVSFLDDAGIARITYSGLIVFDANGRDLAASFSSKPGALLLTFDVRNAVFPVTVDPVVGQAYLKASNSETADRFGAAVAISGDTLVVGTPYERSNAKGVNGNEANNALFDPGAAYVFRRTAGIWHQEAYLKASNTANFHRFGNSVAISGDTIVVGAKNEPGGSPGVDGNQSDKSQVAAGAAYVFVRIGTTWTQQAYLKSSSPDHGDYFGHKVAIDGDTIAVSAIYEDSSATGVGGNQQDETGINSGAVYVFVRNGLQWSQEAYIKSSNNAYEQTFGFALDVSGDTLVATSQTESSGSTGIGGSQTGGAALQSGAAYIFERIGKTWAQTEFVKASNAEAFDLFGASAALDQDTLIVTAVGERSNATGINGDQANNTAFEAGAAYVFTRTLGVWTQTDYLKASNTQTQNRFGFSVDLQGDTAVIGAIFEGGESSGVGGNQAQSSVPPQSGAAYSFERVGGAWSQSAYLKASDPDLNDWFGAAVCTNGALVAVGLTGDDGGGAGTSSDPQSSAKGDSGAVEVYDLNGTCGVERFGSWDNANIADLYSLSGIQPGAVVQLDIRAFEQDSVGLLAISGGPSALSLLGGTLLVDLQTQAVILPMSLLGYKATLSLPVPASAGGMVFYAQALAPDSSQSHGYAWTNGLTITVCP